MEDQMSRTRKQWAALEAELNKRSGYVWTKPVDTFVCGHGVLGLGNCQECRALESQYQARKYDFSNDPLLSA